MARIGVVVEDDFVTVLTKLLAKSGSTGSGHVHVILKSDRGLAFDGSLFDLIVKGREIRRDDDSLGGLLGQLSGFGGFH